MTKKKNNVINISASNVDNVSNSDLKQSIKGTYLYLIFILIVIFPTLMYQLGTIVINQNQILQRVSYIQTITENNSGKLDTIMTSKNNQLVVAKKNQHKHSEVTPVEITSEHSNCYPDE